MSRATPRPSARRPPTHLGAGDVCTGVFLERLMRVRAQAGAAAHADANAFAWGLAAGSARCMHELPTFDVRTMAELHAQVTIEEL